jgi:hypothetical protein
MTGDSMGEDFTLDVAWGYESDLPEALDALANRSAELDGGVWMRTLVPFVAALFARGPDFQLEHEKRLPPGIMQYVGLPAADNAIAARLIDFQTLLAPVMAWRWRVHHFSESVELVTSDVCYAGHGPRDLGYAIPIDRHTVLVVARSDSRTILRWDGSWKTCIEHYDESDFNASGLRRSIGAFARKAVFGPSRDVVQEAALQLAQAPTIGGSLLGGIPMDLECHLYDYFRVLSTIASKPPTEQLYVKSINWQVVARSWTAPVAVQLLRPEQTRGGVMATSNDISLDLTYGLAMRNARRRAGEIGKAAYALMSVDLLEQNGDKIFRRARQ